MRQMPRMLTSIGSVFRLLLLAGSVAAFAACAGKAPAPAPAADSAVAPGTPRQVDADAYEAAIKGRKQDFRACYENEIRNQNPKKSGRVTAEFTVDAHGKVTAASIVKSTLELPKTENCVLEILRSIEFAPPEGGRVLKVQYPFSFKVKK